MYMAIYWTGDNSGHVVIAESLERANQGFRERFPSVKIAHVEFTKLHAGGLDNPIYYFGAL